MNRIIITLLAFLNSVPALAAPQVDGLYSPSPKKRIQAAKRLAATPPEEVVLLDPKIFLLCYVEDSVDLEEFVSNHPECEREDKAVYHLLNVYHHIAKQEILIGNPYQRACVIAKTQGRECATRFLERFLPIGPGGWAVPQQLAGEIDFNSGRDAATKLTGVYNDINVNSPDDLEKYAFINKKLYRVGNRQFAVANFSASNSFFFPAWVGHQFVFENGQVVAHRSSCSVSKIEKRTNHIPEILALGNGFPIFREIQALPDGRHWIGFYSSNREATWSHIADVIDPTSDISLVCSLEMESDESEPSPKFKPQVLNVQVDKGRCILKNNELGLKIAYPEAEER